MNVRKFTDEELMDIDAEIFEGAQIIGRTELIARWYKFETITFVYDGVQYDFEIKKHISPHVYDTEITRGAFPTDQQHKFVDPDKETHYIWEQLISKGKHHINKEDVSLIIDYGIIQE